MLLMDCSLALLSPTSPFCSPEGPAAESWDFCLSEGPATDTGDFCFLGVSLALAEDASAGRKLDLLQLKSNKGSDEIKH